MHHLIFSPHLHSLLKLVRHLNRPNDVHSRQLPQWLCRCQFKLCPWFRLCPANCLKLLPAMQRCQCQANWGHELYSVSLHQRILKLIQLLCSVNRVCHAINRAVMLSLHCWLRKADQLYILPARHLSEWQSKRKFDLCFGCGVCWRKCKLMRCLLAWLLNCYWRNSVHYNSLCIRTIQRQIWRLLSLLNRLRYLLLSLQLLNLFSQLFLAALFNNLRIPSLQRWNLCWFQRSLPALSC